MTALFAKLVILIFISTTTSSGAPKVLADMEEYLQTEWPHLQVYVNSITETIYNI